MAAAVLGILKAGAAYLPLDPSYPVDRLDFMVADARPVVVLTEESLVERLPRSEASPLLCLDREAKAVAELEDTSVGVQVDDVATCYVIYTSGSTGRPKGVVMSHRALVNLIHWQDESSVPSGGVTLQFTPLSFDVSFQEMFSTWHGGGCLVLVGEEQRRDPDQLLEVLIARHVERLFLPFVALKNLALACVRAKELPRSLRCVVTAGEQLQITPEIAELFARLDGCSLHNHYGPSETHVVTAFELEGAPRSWERLPPIGKPIANASGHILDDGFEPVAEGDIGELYLGGDCVADGYLDRPELTAQRFLPDPFATRPGDRLYKTGDLACWRADGTIEYVGRADNQVKVRGYRIEPGEIEAAIEGIEGVRDAVVVAREDTPGDKRLVGYVVPAIGQDVDVAALAATLAGALPDYMVPSAFVVLDALPLTPSGKVDRKALPAPVRPERSEAYVAPRDATEEGVAEAFASVLGVERVGVHDDFFALGGESIRTIQVVARARQAGLHITVKDVYAAPTVAALAKRVRSVAAPIDAEQGLVTGDFTLPPIHRWYFDLGRAEPHQYNQSLLVSLPRRVTEADLRRALDVLGRHHDALRLRFELRDGAWRSFFAPSEQGVLPLEVHDLSAMSADARSRRVSELCAAAQGSFDLARGPTARVLYFDFGEGEPPRLFLPIQHFAVDGVSWRVLMEDLRALLFGEAQQELPPKTTSVKAYADRLAGHAKAADLGVDAEFWRTRSWRDASTLPAPRARIETAGVLVRSLPRELTEAVQTRALVPYRLRIDEAILAAFTLAVRDVLGGEAQLFDVEGHGRDLPFDEVDLSRTVGWFTRIYPVLFDVPRGASIADAVIAVKEQLRTFQSHAFAFPILRYLTSELRDLPAPSILFNYLGQELSGAFPLAPEHPGLESSPRAELTHAIAFDTLIVDGQLRATLCFDPAILTAERAERLLDAFHEGLEGIVRHVDRDVNAGALTPSDVTSVRLDQATLDRITERAAGSRAAAKSLYALSSLQEGFLFHHLKDVGNDPYVPQLVLSFGPTLDADALEHALDALVARHDILRTSLEWEDAPRSVQVVHARARFVLERADWSDVPADALEARLERFLDENRRRGFDLRVAPLTRGTLLRTTDGFRFVWAIHHVVCDGWSIPLLQEELAALYIHRTKGTPHGLEPVPQFGAYLEWLATQSRDASKEFFQRTLAGFSEPSLLLPAGAPTVTWARVAHELSAELSAALDVLARRLRVTLSTLFHAAYAVVLARYTGRSEVLFGTTTSGRTAPLHRVERIVGPFINAAPVRIALPSTSVAEWMASLQEYFSEVRSNEHVALTDAHAWSDVPQGLPLFEALITVEHSPVEDGAVSPAAFGLRSMRVVERTHYPFAVVVEPGANTRLTLTFDEQRFGDTLAPRTLHHLERVLRAFVEDPQARADATPVLTDGERHTLLVEWNATERAFPHDAPIHELFEACAAATPDALALVQGDRTMSYRQLDDASSSVASALRGAGVRDGDMVGISSERSIDLVVGLVAILKAGAAYVPLDPSHPSDRLARLARQAKLSVALDPDGRLELPADIARLRTEELRARGLARQASSRLGSRSPAYVLFTSGSTGTPKGVVVEHRSVVRLVRNTNFATFEPSDVFLGFAPLAFDASTLEIWGPLLNGGTLVMAPPGPLGIGELFDQVERHRVTFLWLTSGLFHSVVDEALERLAGVRQLLAGGGVLSPRHVERVRERFPALRLVNGYGPTENTTFTTCHDIRELVPGSSVPIGRPIANTTVYVLDERGEPSPIGTPGELYTGGAGVARGYLDPAATAAAFVPDPFASRPGARMYRTGDVVRWLPDGTLEFLGRRDEQVKIRGFRIELGEIESAVASCDGVADVLVLAREDVPGTKRLVAYVVPAAGASLDAASLEETVGASLPDYMVPSAFVLLDAFPLNANGKVDRKALPAPDLAASAEAYVAPRNAVEETLARIFRELLGAERVGVDDDFFALGGDSILVIRLASMARRAGLSVTVKDVSGIATVARLAEVAARANAATEWAPASDVRPHGLDQATLDAIATRATGALSRARGVYALSPLQEGFLFHHLSDDEDPYVSQVPFAMAPSTDVGALERAFQALLDRHEVLRTSFVWQDVPRAVQVVHEKAQLSLTQLDWSNVADGEVEARLEAWMAEDKKRGFDLDVCPLSRVTVIRTRSAFRVVWTTHHITSDGWSEPILLKELLAHYRHFRDGSPLRLEPAARYGAFLEWLGGRAQDETEAFFRRTLGGLTEPTLAAGPEGISTPSWKQASVELGEELSAALAELSRRLRVTLSTVMHAAWAIVLGRYTGKSDVVFGSTTSGRSAPVPDIERMVGLFINAVPVRVRLGGEPVADWLVDLQRTWSELRSHEFAQLAEVQRWSDVPSGEPLFDTLLTFQNYPADEEAEREAAALGFSSFQAIERTHYPVSLTVVPGRRTLVELIWDSERFDVPHVLEHIETVLRCLLDAATRNVPLTIPSLMTAAERRRVLVEWNRTERDYEYRNTPAWIEHWASSTPDATALVADDATLTFAELNERANRLARLLRRRGVGTGDRVATWLVRSARMIVAQLAIMKAGAAYVPIDPVYPFERVAYVVDDVRAALVLSSRDLSRGFADLASPLVLLDGADVQEELAKESGENVALPLAPSDVAYVIYTSGTTGKPKGSIIEHRNLANFASEHQRLVQMTPADRLIQISGPAFDGSIEETWPTLTAGASLYVVNDELRMSPDELLAWVTRHEITGMSMPTALAMTVLDADWTRTRVRIFAIGGEALRRRPRADSPFTLVNDYGPTETTCYVTSEPVEPGDHPVTTIGRPIQNTATYVLDASGEPTPIGVFGEIYVGGQNVGRGYFGRPELTAEKFVPDPFAPEPGARMYRTGDRACWIADGRIEYVGRVDDQVKIRGFRIEPGEVAVVLRTLDSVRDAVVVARQVAPGDMRLVGYVVPQPGSELQAEQLSAELSKRLPDYMVPSALMVLDALPLTPNGKVDRRALPAPDFTSTAAFVEPRNELETALAKIWQEILKMERVGVNDNYFTIGGHSLNALQVIARIRRDLKFHMDVRDVFERPTVAQLAEAIAIATGATETESF